MHNFQPELSQITQTIWKTILNLEVCENDKPNLDRNGDDTLIGNIHITGDWCGTLEIKCPASLAKRIASIMFSKNEQALDIIEVKDALCEITNITGGNLKALFSEQCFLSMPTVAETEIDLHVLGGNKLTALSFSCDNEKFLVTLIKRKPNSIENGQSD